jgi:hypothetical protein
MCQLKKYHWKPGVVVHPCSPSTWEAEEQGGLQVQGQPGLHSETLNFFKKLSYILFEKRMNVLCIQFGICSQCPGGSTYLGHEVWEDHSLRPAWAKS